MFWLASYPKSGNTWVKLFTEAYALGNTNINSARATAGDQSRIFYRNAACCELSEISHLEMLAIREASLHYIMRLMRPYVIKTHNANVLFHERALIPKWCTLRAIYVMRDPRDVAISMLHYMNGLDKLDDAIDKLFEPHWVINFTDEPNIYHYVGDWKAHVESWVNQTEFPVLVMRYEDMVANPYHEFKRFVDFHPWLSFDRRRFLEALQDVHFEKLQKKERADGFQESKGKNEFFRSGTVAQWQAVFTGEQLKRISPLVEFYENVKQAA